MSAINHVTKRIVLVVCCLLLVSFITPWMMRTGAVALPLLFYALIGVAMGFALRSYSFLWGMLLGSFPLALTLLSALAIILQFNSPASPDTTDIITAVGLNKLDYYLNYFLPFPLITGVGATAGASLYKTFIDVKRQITYEDMRKQHRE